MYFYKAAPAGSEKYVGHGVLPPGTHPLLGGQGGGASS